ncbi:MAG TPA: nitroreductase/quinone reductase family protein [Aquihabitans sp.]|jgi:deazaflavin-dependent oxidoreductase (nitroreductase family)|nr:nitroreductase/quinone reductase family protein [Aquihabitans sp.]
MAPFAIDGRIGRATRAMATSATFRRAGPKVVPAVDRVLHRVTGGRVILSRALVPSMVLTTTGRRSGQARTSPLACVPDDAGGWWVVGSNFGQEVHPAWTANLLADPLARVSYGGSEVEVRAELLDAAAKAEVWPRLVAVWPAYDDYVRSSGRDLRVFHLVPAAGA